MKRKSTDYKTPDAGGWMNVCDDIFLAQFRGRPCEICGATSGFYNGKTIRSMGHHVLSKELHRAHRYDTQNIVTLCPIHHLGAEMSPHSHDTAAQAAFYDWMATALPFRYELMMARRHDKFNKEWCYREKYIELGGEIHSKTGLMKDYRPVNHAAKVREAEKGA
jgi:hypothetical protein